MMDDPNLDIRPPAEDFGPAPGAPSSAPGAPQATSAMNLAREGFHIFPVQAGTKMPAIEDWPNQATRDETTIREWWSLNPDFNIGIATGKFGNGGQSLCVLDIDVKKGKTGSETFQNLRKAESLPRTRTNVTASGGRHILYVTDTPVKNSAEKLGSGLDVRGAGGFIVGPGSVIGGAEYQSDSRPMEPAPASLVTLCGKPREKNPNVAVIEDLDTPANLGRAIEWLVNLAPKAIEGQGGDAMTFKVVCHVKDLGVSELAALELMSKHWNGAKAFPPWDYAELATKVSNAYQYGKDPIGVATPEADFEPIGEDLPAPANDRGPSKLDYIYARDIERREPSPDLIQKTLSLNAMSVVYGPSNSGKTFAAIKMAFCIATGRPFFGRECTEGAIIYVAAESPASVKNRVIALKQHFGIEDFPFIVVPSPVNLLDPKADAGELVKLIQHVTDELDMPVRLCVIDTLSRALAGGNENSPDDMGALVMNLDKIRFAADFHLMVVHHSGKDKAAGARGHSLLRAATDTEIEVGEDKQTGQRFMRVTKQRDFEFGDPIGFQLHVVDLGGDYYGGRETTCVCEEYILPAESDFDDLEDFHELPDFTEPQAIVIGAIRSVGDPYRGQIRAHMVRVFAEVETVSNFTKAKDKRDKLRQLRRTLEQLENLGGIIRISEDKQRVTLIHPELARQGETT